MIPAGLIDDQIEFFNDGINLDQAYCLTGGRVYRVCAAPPFVQALLTADMAINAVKVTKLIAMGFTGIALKEKYCSCVFGPLDGEADAVGDRLLHLEYNHCRERNTCPGRGIVCGALQLANGKLSDRQTEVLALTGKCMLNKEIADMLGISEETVKVHERTIRRKAGADNKMDLVKLAHQKNLIE